MTSKKTPAAATAFQEKNAKNAKNKSAMHESNESEAISSELPVPNFPIVGIGASAGGLAAFESFFSGIPKDRDPGMAFVLIQHLAPDHKSILSELIRRYTSMHVYEVEDGMVLKPNCITLFRLITIWVS
jgi:two-component system CheB/CheR fusion protein